MSHPSSAPGDVGRTSRHARVRLPARRLGCHVAAYADRSPASPGELVRFTHPGETEGGVTHGTHVVHAGTDGPREGQRGHGCRRLLAGGDLPPPAHPAWEGCSFAQQLYERWAAERRERREVPEWFSAQDVVWEPWEREAALTW